MPARFAFTLLSSALLTSVAAAQPAGESRGICWRNASSKCRAVVLTNMGVFTVAGAFAQPAGIDPGSGLPTRLDDEFHLGVRATSDWGILLRLSDRDAIGASFAASVESVPDGQNNFETAVFLRYRRQLGGEKSLDLAVGTPVLRDNEKSVSPFGLVKWNLNNTVGIALRPEVRKSIADLRDTPMRRSNLFVSAGVEVGRTPGLGLSVLYGALLTLFSMGAAGID
ncbi:MAG: hypothetical protein HOP28_13660 [Gemmatimonadales bacterium]|nr:hypothetical protein [Gemmatimonadales bacterium]